MITDKELSYLAGFIDGEGCITIVQKNNKPSFVTVAIYNTNEYIIRLIAKWFKGNIVCTKNKNKYKDRWNKSNDKDRWMFQAYDKNARTLLEAVYPYLLIKKEQAHIALEYQKLSMSGHMRYQISSIISKVKKELFNQIRILNHKGKDDYIINSQ